MHFCKKILSMDQQFGKINDYTDAYFEGIIRACESRVRIPKGFYNTWSNELGKAVILEDDYGNIFAVEIDDFYHIEVGTLVHFKYVGQGTFKIRFSITPIGVPRPPLETTSRIQKGTKRMLWESNIFDEQLPIWKKMVIPTNVVKDEFINEASSIGVKLPNNVEEEWEIIWKNGRRVNQVVLGRDWHNFCRERFNFGK
ncbi:hypothetical protein DEO72_LG1g1347 [Vigna unguiculata]|uniref:Uncharacterized protein n=1 Tax=Vigna unguiculata TaxID=3917 RepID=A0A4D6KM32_VIGUN|nr:hypothetical protein DEO72_LG1g1347 [Vigna unguiculata]